MWGVSAKCPLFLKKTGKKVAGVKSKKRTLRANKALNAHTIRTLASGAAGNAAVLAQAEARALRCDVQIETSKYPLLPTVQRSAAALIDAVFTAYMQEAFSNSVLLKQSIRAHKKVTQRCAQMGIDALNERIAHATSFVPASVVPRLAMVASKKMKAVADPSS